MRVAVRMSRKIRSTGNFLWALRPPIVCAQVEVTFRADSVAISFARAARVRFIAGFALFQRRADLTPKELSYAADMDF